MTIRKVSKNGINIVDFFKNDYVIFADYRASQRLPNYDGLIETQRKVMYTFLKQNKTEKEKTVTASAKVLDYTHYNHGDKSMSGVISNMAASYQNNIPLLSEDGSFGFRSNPRPADPRYTYTRLKKYTHLLFNEIDNKIFIEKQYESNKEIEPKSLIPLLPLLLINGQHQIGVGFAIKVLPRNPTDIINLLKDLLSKKIKVIPHTITPWYRDFIGDIRPKDDNNISWVINGILEKKGKNIIIIKEVPIGTTRDNILKKLNDLKEKDKIISYKEDINKNSFYLEIKVPETIFKMSDDKLYKLFNLTSNVTEYINIINEKNEIITEIYTIGQYLYNFVIWRLNIYNKRKEYLLEQLLTQIQKMEEIIRYISQVNNEEINIHKQTKKKIEDQIINNNYRKFDDSYNYLTHLRIYDLTEEEIQDYQDKIKNKENEYKILEQKTPASLWLEDIEIFEKEWKKDIKGKQ